MCASAPCKFVGTIAASVQLKWCESEQPCHFCTLPKSRRFVVQRFNFNPHEGDGVAGNENLTGQVPSNFANAISFGTPNFRRKQVTATRSIKRSWYPRVIIGHQCPRWSLFVFIVFFKKSLCDIWRWASHDDHGHTVASRIYLVNACQTTSQKLCLVVFVFLLQMPAVFVVQREIPASNAF